MLFRRFRHSLIPNNRFTKYLLYAIGEIILVVIGILIALQINNWNEGRKEKYKETQILINLQNEFKDNLRDLDSISAEVDKVILTLEEVFDLFLPAIDHSSLGSLDSLLSDALNSPNWKPSAYLLNSLGNSGSIAELQNENLKLLLYQWSRQRNEMEEVQQRTELTGEEIIRYLKQHGSLRNVDINNDNFRYRASLIVKDNSALLADPEFENHIDDKLYMYKQTKQWLIRARITLVKLIDEIDSSILKNKDG